MNSDIERRAWADEYLADARTHIARDLFRLRNASPREDMRLAFDFITLHDPKRGQISVRTRDFDQYEHKGDVTLRLGPHNSTDMGDMPCGCEAQKVLYHGFSDYYFYGWAHPDMRGVHFAYVILDLDVVREIIASRDLLKVGRFQTNGPGDTRFLALRLYPLRPAVVAEDRPSLGHWRAVGAGQGVIG